MQQRIVIVTDSSCDLPANVTQSLPIRIVPLRIITSNGDFRDGIDIDADEVIELLETEFPKTSMPSPQDIYSTFEELEQQDYSHAIVIPISSGLSSTYETFEMVAKEFTKMKIHVIDSRSVSWMLGFLVLEAAKLVQKKKEFTYILDYVNHAKEKITGYFIIESLKYIQAGGRIGKIASYVGSVLNIVPIISFDKEGKLHPYSIARGKKQALKKMIDTIHKQLESTRLQMAIVHSKAEKEAQSLKERFQSFANVEQIHVSTIGPALSVHAGPGLIGIIVYPISESSL